MDYAVIMAGGTGKRLWPLSRANRPKQVLRILDGRTLLRRCFDRLSPIFDAKNIIVLTNAAYVDLVRENLPDLPADNVIAEPAVRDTAGAIGLAATVLAKTDADATIAVVTADQVIQPAQVFQQALDDALAFINANPQTLLTFAIPPTSPSTVYGYINCTDPRNVPGCRNKLYSVKAFKEKPDRQTADKYLKSGHYFWNSGMFVWKAATILSNLSKFLPDAAGPLAKIQAAWDTPQRQRTLDEWFPKLPTISIDYAVMEKADNVHAIKLDCRWLDLGSFTALADVVDVDANGNVVAAATSELLDSTGNIIVTEDTAHLIAGIGLENMIIAHSADATLVCPADQAHRLKDLLDQIAEHGREKFL